MARLAHQALRTWNGTGVCCPSQEGRAGTFPGLSAREDPRWTRGRGNYEAVLAFEKGHISGALKLGSTILIRKGGFLIRVFFREWAPYGNVFSIRRQQLCFVG